MSDYNKLTVANLRQVLKERGIPSTGLTRKADIIKKLEEHDEQNSPAPAEAEAGDVAEGSAAQVEPEPQPEQAVEDTQDDAAPNEIVADSETATAVPELPELTPPEPSEAPQVPETTGAKKLGESAMDTDQSATEPAGNTGLAPSAPGEQIPLTNAEPTSEPIEATQLAQSRTHTQDFAMPNATPSPVLNERQTVEEPEPLSVSERSASSSVEHSRINTEERELDSKKRKRRSHSPDISTQDVKAKKPRPSGEAAPEVHLKEDEDTVIDQRQPEEVVSSKEDDTNGLHKDEPDKEEAPVSRLLPIPEISQVKDTEETPEEPKAPTERREKGDRYKNLLQSATPATSADMPSDDRPIVPALHPATPAVYIRDFMRPLRLEPLRAHLISLASPPSASPDPSILKSLFIDSMKTHALVLFSSTIAASRVRASLHGSIWPPEGQRKELWVDFIPEDKVEGWIQAEEDAIAAEKDARAAGRPIPSKRFEVVYPESENGGVQAAFQEIGSGAPSNAPKGPRGGMERRRESQQALLPTTDQDTKRDLGKSFQTLDQLFDSTTAKPKLYYLPVHDDKADRRLEELKDETSPDWRPEDQIRGRGRDRLHQKMRFSFNEDDRLVEVGGDFGPWADDGGFRGGRGGRGGFRSDRGGFRGRGGWRG